MKLNNVDKILYGFLGGLMFGATPLTAIMLFLHYVGFDIELFPYLLLYVPMGFVIGFCNAEELEKWLFE